MMENKIKKKKRKNNSISRLENIKIYCFILYSHYLIIEFLKFRFKKLYCFLFRQKYNFITQF